MAWNIFEASSLTDDQRLDYTAATIMLRSKIAGDDRFSDTSVSKMGRSRAAYPGWIPKSGDGPIFLGGELQDKKIKVRNLDRDRVYWQTSPGKYTAIGRDWSDWQKRLVNGLDQYGIGDPRSDENARAWALALQLAAAAAGVVLVATGVGAGAGAAVAGAGTAAAQAIYAEADRLEQEFSTAAAGMGQTVAVTGSGREQAIGTAAGGVASAVTSSIESGEVDADALAQSAASLYGAITGTSSTETAPTTATVPATTENAFVAWAKTPTGMVVIGAAALFVVYQLGKRR